MRRSNGQNGKEKCLLLASVHHAIAPGAQEVLAATAWGRCLRQLQLEPCDHPQNYSCHYGMCLLPIHTYCGPRLHKCVTGHCRGYIFASPCFRRLRYCVVTHAVTVLVALTSFCFLVQEVLVPPLPLWVGEEGQCQGAAAAKLHGLPRGRR